MENTESQAVTDRLISIFEAKLKGHNVVMQKEVGLSTAVAAVEAMKDWATQQQAPLIKEMAELKRQNEELKEEDRTTDLLCQKVLQGKGMIYIRGIETKIQSLEKQNASLTERIDSLMRRDEELNQQAERVNELEKQNADLAGELKNCTDNLIVEGAIESQKLLTKELAEGLEKIQKWLMPKAPNTDVIDLREFIQKLLNKHKAAISGENKV